MQNAQNYPIQVGILHSLNLAEYATCYITSGYKQNPATENWLRVWYTIRILIFGFKCRIVSCNTRRDMDSKAKSILEKALQEKSRGNYDKALKRISDTINKFPDEFDLYIEAADVCIASGESMQASQYLKRAHSKFTNDRDKVLNFARDKVRTENDPVLGKYVLELTVKNRDLDDAYECLEDLQDRAIRDLLQRTRTKRQSMNSASSGGYSLKGEMVHNALCEALMCLRLGRLKEAARGLRQILDEKPVENETLEPFLAGLEKRMSKSGRIRLLYARSLIIAQHVHKAMQRVVTAARFDSSLVSECLELVREASENAADNPECIDRALVELLLIEGDVTRAAELLASRLDEKPDESKDIMDQIRPHLEKFEDTLVLHYVYMDAAFNAELPASIVKILKGLQNEDSHRADLLQWLTTKSKENFLPVELMLIQGEMAIQEKDYDLAVEVLTAICHNSPNDAPVALAMAERQMQSAPTLKKFFEMQSKESADVGAAREASDDGFDFEHFENKEFSFAATAKPEEIEIEHEEPSDSTISDQAALDDDHDEDYDDEDDSDDGVDSDFDNSSSESIFAATNKKSKKKKKKAKSKNKVETSKKAAVSEEPAEISAPDPYEEIVWEEEDENGNVAAKSPGVVSEPTPVDEPALVEELVTQPAYAQGAPDTPNSNDHDTAFEPSSAHVTNVANELYKSGASTFFYVDAETEDEASTATIVADATDMAGDSDAAEASDDLGLELNTGAQLSLSGNADDGDADNDVDQFFTGSAVNAANNDAEDLDSRDEDVDTDVADDVDNEDIDDDTDDEDEHVERAVIELTTELDDDIDDDIDDVDDDTESEHQEDEQARPLSFEARFERFLDGKIDNEATVAMIDEAYEAGLWEELRELLHFQPESDNEHFIRQFYQAEYHINCGRTLPALELLRTIDRSTLFDDQVRIVGLKQASCERMVCDFEAANNTFMKLKEAFPDSEEIAQLAKRNYEQYLQDQCNEAPVLEKTASLTTDL